MQSYRLYNLMMIFCCLCFAFGSVWIWRGERAEVRRENEINKVVDTIKTKTKTQTEIKTSNLEIGNRKSEIRDNAATSTSESEKENVKKLPERINLNVPFTSQAPEKIWQDPWEDFCEEAAVLMLDAYYEKYNLSPLFAKDELVKIWEWEEKQGWGKSIEMEKVAKVVDEYFSSQKSVKSIKSKVVIDPTIEQIKTFIAEGKPVLTVADGKVLPNPYFRNGGPVYHALIIRGYTEDKFITNDPGSGWSKNFAYKYDVLMNAIHDWNNGKVSEGKKVILVIE